MPVGNSRAGTRFFLALAALTALLVAVAALGLLSLRSVEHADNQVFDDNFITAEANSRLSTDLGQAQGVSLQILASDTLPEAERLRALLEQTVRPRIEADITRLLRLHAGDPSSELAQIRRIPGLWQAYDLVARRGALVPGAPVPTGVIRSGEVARVEHAIGPAIAYVTARQTVETHAAAAAHEAAQDVFERSRNWLIVAALLALLAVGVLVRIGITLRALLAEQSQQRRFSQKSNEYIEVLQGTGSEDEAQALLARQIVRVLPGARVAVLARNNSDNRLEARTSLAELAELHDPLAAAEPRSCMAIRFARSHSEGAGGDTLVRCGLCGRLPGTSTCEPLLVGGEVIGSVLVATALKPDPGECQRVRETVVQAAPVLGNLRNLALAELRAATDALTGLPNHRAVQDTLKRMVAQASRTISPLAAVLVDLDHFKQVNDVYGHDRGDELLAAVGVAFRNVMRASDFVGRYGGEEFLILLPSADREGAVKVAEAVRAAIAAIRIPGIDKPITASAGVAVLPDDGGDSVTLFRAADRALYAAKHAGRNRVHTAMEAGSEGPTFESERPSRQATVPTA
jgi:diguanylate cyclase (GGDEF)-like protein